MGIITDIKQAKGKKARKHIYMDNSYICTLNEFTVFKYKIKVGQEITAQELEDITFESESSEAFELAVDLISKTQKTRKQVYDYLKSKGYMPKLCQNTVDKLDSYHYINDEVYAKNYVNCYINKYGKKKMRFALQQRGVPNSIIDTVLDELEPQDDAVLQMAQKFMKNKERTQQNFEKLYRHLASKGFDWDTINSAVYQIKRAENENGD